MCPELGSILLFAHLIVRYCSYPRSILVLLFRLHHSYRHSLLLCLLLPYLHFSHHTHTNSHLFGDVPSNLVIGWLKTKLAPDCSGSDDAVYTSDECRGDADGVRLTIFIANVWLFWCVILFFAAYWMSNRRLETVIEKETREGVHHPGTSVPGDSPANNLKQPLLQA